MTALRDFSEARDRERLLAQSIVDTIRDPLVILEDDMTVVSASRAFLRLFGVPAEAVIGYPLAELAQGQWRVGKLQELLGRIVPDDGSLDGFEVEDEFPGLGRHIFQAQCAQGLPAGQPRHPPAPRDRGCDRGTPA